MTHHCQSGPHNCVGCDFACTIPETSAVLVAAQREICSPCSGRMTVCCRMDASFGNFAEHIHFTIGKREIYTSWLKVPFNLSIQNSLTIQGIVLVGCASRCVWMYV